MGKFAGSLREFAAWFERQKRVLPWREDPALYRVWISEIMLQQTQVATVIPYFERFVARFPTVEKLAEAATDEVMTHWAGLGYYSRARNLHRGAQAIVMSGGFPRTRDAWLEIPGVGPYTAGAIVSIALDHPEAILDGNVERVLSRVRRVGARPATHLMDPYAPADLKTRLWRLSGIFVRRANELGIRPSVLNQALMELGATVCTPKKPRCGECPLAGICRARASGEVAGFPVKKRTKEWIAVRERAHCVLDAEGRVLLERSSPGRWRAGLWDLPDRLPESWAASMNQVGTVETRHVVTRHRITRETSVYRLGKRKWEAAEPAGTEQRWEGVMSLLGNDGDRPSLAIGSALRRTLTALMRNRELSALFPEVPPAP